MNPAVPAQDDAPLTADPVAEATGLLDLLSARPLAIERGHASRSYQVAIQAIVASLAMGAVYGVAVGCTDPRQAVHNVVAVPVVVLMSLACAAPAGMLTWKMLGHGTRASDVAISVATGLFSATLVLAAAAPLLALYYLTTDYVGAPLALSVVALATAGGVFNAFRAGAYRRREGVSPLAVFLPLGVTLGCLLLAELQLIHLASPILPEDTVFDHGVEGLLP